MRSSLLGYLPQLSGRYAEDNNICSVHKTNIVSKPYFVAYPHSGKLLLVFAVTAYVLYLLLKRRPDRNVMPEIVKHYRKTETEAAHSENCKISHFYFPPPVFSYRRTCFPYRF